MYEYIEFIICYGQTISTDQVKQETRKEEIVYARQLIMYFCVMFKVGSYVFIGNLVGGKDHATVSHALKTIENYCDTDKIKKAKIDYYESLIRKVIKLTEKTENLKDVLKPLEEEISLLEQRCINLTIQLAFLRTKTLAEGSHV